MNKDFTLVKILLAINIGLFILVQISPQIQDSLALFYFENPAFHLWQPITHMFMHGSISHLLFNMLALYSFGEIIEKLWGPKKFLLFYLLCGLGACLANELVNYYQFHSISDQLLANGYSISEITEPLNNGQYLPVWDKIVSALAIKEMIIAYIGTVVGASGAIYGLLVAFAFIFPEYKLIFIFLPVPIKAKFFVPVILLIDLVLGLNGGAFFGSSTGIAHFAHLGGAAMGLFLMHHWRRRR